MATLLIALDCSFARAQQVLAAARDLGCGYKLGLRALLDYRFATRPMIGRAPFMMDIKLYDTPDTVRQVCEVIRDLWSPDIVTVHPKVAAVASATLAGETKVVSVPLLTSEPDPGHQAIYDLYKAEAARRNCDGFVCAPPDLPMVKKACEDAGRNDMIFICPGIRLVGSDRDNHQRTGDPNTTVKAGADYLVVGRPIIESDDPCTSVQRFATEMIVI